MIAGLKEFELEYMIAQIKTFPEIERALIFGSRAKGTHKDSSDIDLAIIGENITFDTVSRLHSLLEDKGPLPYFIDVVDYTHLNHQELKAHIDRKGLEIYQKNAKQPT